MVRQVELNAQLLTSTNLSMEKIGAESKTKATNSLVKPTIAAATASQEGIKDPDNKTVGKTDGNTLPQQNTLGTSVNSCQLCSQVGHQASQCKRYRMLLKDHKDQRAHPYKNPQGRQNNRKNRPQHFQNKSGRDNRIPWCHYCNKKGHHTNSC